MDLISRNSAGIKGIVEVPGDKSISHRAAMLLSLARGRSEINNFLFSEDCKHTLRAMSMLGANITVKNKSVIINGTGKKNLKTPPGLVYLGNSGTSMRLLSGILCGIEGSTVLYGDESLSKRPMRRIIEPLTLMGGRIRAIYSNDMAPLFIEDSSLIGIDYHMKVASAQVKSCILLASLFAEGNTKISELYRTRDHTEKMLSYLGCDISIEGSVISFKCGQEINSGVIEVPGDISSAAFLIASALLVPKSDLIIKNLLLNPERTGFLDAVLRMGGNIEILDRRLVCNEYVGDIRVRSSELQGIVIEGKDIPRTIDELPLLAVISAFAEGRTIIREAEELRNKESDRIGSVASNLRRMGTEVEEMEDGLIIHGRSFKKNERIIFDSFYDHRIAMAFSLTGLILGEVKVKNCDNIATSFPEFINLMNAIGANISELKDILRTC